jgi:hypothetical protein
MAPLSAAVKASASPLPLAVATAMFAVSGQPPLTVPATATSSGETAAL